jgi:hypothetical protein
MTNSSSEQVRALGGETPPGALPRLPRLTELFKREIFLLPPPPARAAVENLPVSGVYPFPFSTGPWLPSLPGTFVQLAGGWLRSVDLLIDGVSPVRGSVRPNPKRRIPRKSKKWHKKHGWVLHFDARGRAYFTRSYLIVGAP